MVAVLPRVFAFNVHLVNQFNEKSSKVCRNSYCSKNGTDFALSVSVNMLTLSLENLGNCVSLPLNIDIDH